MASGAIATGYSQRQLHWNSSEEETAAAAAGGDRVKQKQARNEGTSLSLLWFQEEWLDSYKGRRETKGEARQDGDGISDEWREQQQ